jgi:hypothetical protein
LLAEVDVSIEEMMEEGGGVEWNLRNTTTLMAFKIRFQGEAATMSKKALLSLFRGGAGETSLRQY